MFLHYAPNEGSWNWGWNGGTCFHPRLNDSVDGIFCCTTPRHKLENFLCLENKENVRSFKNFRKRQKAVLQIQITLIGSE